MNMWIERIEEFAKPAHKNVSLFIESASSEEIEKVLDAIAENAQWTYKEIKSIDGKKVITYQTTELGQFSSFNFQIIEYVFTPKEDGITLDIESRYIYSNDKSSLVLAFFLRSIGPNQFWDFFSKNRQNIQYILNSLHEAFPAVKIVHTKEAVTSKPTKKLSKRSLLLALIKIYCLLIILIIIFAAFYGIAIMAFNYYQYTFK